MAHIEKRVRNGRTTWRARYRAPDGRERSKVFEKRAAADRFLTSVQHSKFSGSYVDPSAGKVTFGVYAERWRSQQAHRPTTAAQVEGNMRLHVLPFLGHRPIGAIRRAEIQALISSREELLAPTTVELVYGYVRSVFRAAVGDRVITASPCDGVKMRRPPRVPIVPPSTDMVLRLIDAFPRRYRALVVLGAGTGLRQGEAFGLSVDRVDFLRKTVRVDRQVVLLNGQGPVFGPPKTDASFRTVPVPNVVLAALSEHLAEFPAEPGALVFTNERAEMIRRTRFSDAWRSVARPIGFAPGTGFHVLRHYYASLLIHAGESVKVVQARLGHKTAMETLDTYGHLWPESEEQTRVAVDSAFCSARAAAAPPRPNCVG
jgi:integrase